MGKPMGTTADDWWAFAMSLFVMEAGAFPYGPSPTCERIGGRKLMDSGAMRYTLNTFPSVLFDLITDVQWEFEEGNGPDTSCDSQWGKANRTCEFDPLGKIVESSAWFLKAKQAYEYRNV